LPAYHPAIGSSFIKHRSSFTKGVCHLPRRAIYPGSFDPPTSGHLDIIERASRLFDELIVAIIVNPNKHSFFTIEERTALLQDALKDRCANVTIESFGGLLMDYAQQRQASALIRGLRSSGDYEYELPMILMNRHLAPNIETVLLVGDPSLSHVSSSLVKEVFKLGGSMDGLVPAQVIEQMQQKRK
jgi:pantetheine-phosphate adenylyltransferase